MVGSVVINDIVPYVKEEIVPRLGNLPSPQTPDTSTKSPDNSPSKSGSGAAK